MSYRCSVCDGCESSDGSEFLSVNESEYDWWSSEDESTTENVEEDSSEKKNDEGKDEAKKWKSKSRHQEIEYVDEPSCSDDNSSSEQENDEGNENYKKSEQKIKNEVTSDKVLINSDSPKNPPEQATLPGNENPLDKKNDEDGPMGKEDSSSNEIPSKEVEEVLVKEVSAPTMLAYGHSAGRYRSHRRGRSGRGRTRAGGSSRRTRRPYGRRPKRHVRRRRAMWTTSVNMPTGTPQNVTVPVKPGMKWKCGDKSKLINLNPNGKMGKKEFDIVANEMKNSSTGQQFQVTKVEKIVNACLWKRYRYRRRIIIEECGQANERFLFHGSKSIKQLVDIGLDERYAKIDGWFGAGLYFACNSDKSHAYTGGTGQMLLCRVLLGKLEQVSAGVHNAHASPTYHSLEGMVALHEFVVYRGEQVYPEYLITYT